MADRPVVFLDLDDTLFSSLRKLGPDGESFEPVAYDRGGAALSYMAPRQRAWFDWLRETTTIVPTTGRNLDAFRRVHLPFDGQAILSHGGLIISPDGIPDSSWHKRMSDACLLYRATLNELCNKCLDLARDMRCDVRGRVIADAGIDLYCSIKHNMEDVQALALLAAEVRRIAPEDWTVHLNDNNMAIMPPAVSKADAVQHVLEHLPYQPPFVVGIGDSVSDLPFLAKADLAVLPRESQAIRKVIESCSDG